MEAFRGQLTRNGQTIIENIEGRLDIEVGPSGAQAWSGYFAVPAGQSVELEEPFELVLGDGRRNKIRVQRVNQSAGGTTASFGRS